MSISECQCNKEIFISITKIDGTILYVRNKDVINIATSKHDVVKSVVTHLINGSLWSVDSIDDAASIVRKLNFNI